MSTPAEVLIAREKWVTINTKMGEVESLLMKLIKHANTTPEQLCVAHAAYKEMHSAVAAMQAELEQKYPVKALVVRNGHATHRSLWSREML